MQRYTSYLFLWNILQVSGGSSAPYQELKNYIYCIEYFVKTLLLPATVVEEIEFSSISSTTVAGSSKGLTKHPVLYIQFLSSW